MHFLSLIVIFFWIQTLSANEVNLFTTRHYDSDIKLYDEFSKQTGIKVNVISGKSKPLEKRIIEEGRSCVGDIFFLADAGRLLSADEKGLFKKIKSSSIKKKVPKQFRSSNWVGITKRARIIFFNPEFTKYEDIKDLSYEDLSSPQYKNSIAIRQSNNVYNQSLVSSIIENKGLNFTKNWLNGLVNNFSRQPTGNDRAQILSVAAGESKFAIANTYYYALMASGQKGEGQKKASEKVRPLFPNQNNRGTHMNISGVGILKHSPNTDNAIKFIEFLLTPKAQKHIVNNTYEYPIIETVQPSKLIQKLGTNFKQDNTTNVLSYGKWQKKAFELMRQAKWN